MILSLKNRCPICGEELKEKIVFEGRKMKRYKSITRKMVYCPGKHCSYSNIIPTITERMISNGQIENIKWWKR